ncbi:MAG TPA: extracellular solute-binding protein [Methylomirabilota bacterium]|jgi:iron(III) transport system substrate-binding protein|nr:extracellular solute-binding protein [Methylomirabilota bacterium]
MNASIRLPARALLTLGVVLTLLNGAVPAAGIEDELVVQTPVSAFIVEAMLKEFTVYAKEKWNVGLRARAQRAGTPVSYERIVGWKGQPEADIFWGGEPALFNSLAQKSLLTKLELASDVWESIPPSIGVPKPIPLKDPGRFWVGTALEIYGIAYNPRLVKRLGAPEPRDWDDVLSPKLKGQVAQCTPTRSSSSHATYQVILQSRGEAEGWEWLKRLGANTGVFVASSRDVPAVVAKGEFAVGFGVPSYFVFEEKLAGFDIKFVAPKNAFVTPEPFAILAGARHPKAAREFLAFLLSERGQRLFMGRGLFPITPRYKVHGPPGSTAELAVQLTGGVRSFFEPPVANIYDDEIARARYREVNERFRRDIEEPWEALKRR